MSSITDVLVSPPLQSIFAPTATTTLSPSSAKVRVTNSWYEQQRPTQESHMENATSLMSLSSELLTLICEQLRYMDLDALCALRLVASRLDAIATPVLYRSVEMSQCLVEPDAEERFSGAFAHIARFTKHVLVHSNLDPAGVRRVLDIAGKVLTVTWRFDPNDLQNFIPGVDESRSLYKALNLDVMRENRTELYIENFPLRQSGDNAFTQTIPSEYLVSLKLANPTPPLSAQLKSLKRLVLESPHLQTFHYQDRGQGTRFSFDKGERMPPFKDLGLKCYDWNHSKDEVRKHWDFTRLRSLALLTMPTYSFLKSVPLNQLSQLQTLQVEDWSSHLPDKRPQATELLYRLMGYHCTQLENLHLTCHIQLLGLEAIIRHQDTLRNLCLRDHVGFRNEGRCCPTLDPTNVLYLAQNLHRLESIELDMDVKAIKDPGKFLAAVLEFPRLETVTIHIQTTIPPSDGYIPRVDHDHKAAAGIFSILLDGRERKEPDRPFKGITINVGGWRPVMVRRLGANWRELNDHGIFAERCFVLERIDGENMVQEIECVESSSSRATPER